MLADQRLHLRVCSKLIDLQISVDDFDYNRKKPQTFPQLQAEHEQASRTYFHQLQRFRLIVDSISARSWALLTWSDQQLQALAEQECIGPGATAEEVQSRELADLLQRREAAYVAALMALKQWEAVEQAYAAVDEKGNQRYSYLEEGLFHPLEIYSHSRSSPNFSNDAAKKWGIALSMVPGGKLCEELTNDVPQWVLAFYGSWLSQHEAIPAGARPHLAVDQAQLQEAAVCASSTGTTSDVDVFASGMRNTVWQRVDEASAQPNPDGWNLLQVQDNAGSSEIRQAVLGKGKLPASAELHILLSEPISAYQLLEDVHQLPSGDLSVKAVARKHGAGASGPGALCVLLGHIFCCVTWPPAAFHCHVSS
ncbi:hypothetical protein WJX74_000932 [Apatococcus lobatus]|uniref:Nuclear pore complex protein n=1 Tax=Apatococcus lobatus TaxID=904363 RepID=A0AAW1QLC0_9CHLO